MPRAGKNPPEQLVKADALLITNGRHDVPVAEAPRRSPDGERVVGVVDDHASRGNCVDRGSVGSRDIDAEMKVVSPWIVQVPADRVLTIEGLDRPSVRGAYRGPVADGSGLRQFGLCGLPAGGGRRVGREAEKEGGARTAEAMIGLLRLLICAVLVSMPPPSWGPQTAQSRRSNGPLIAAVMSERLPLEPAACHAVGAMKSGRVSAGTLVTTELRSPREPSKSRTTAELSRSAARSSAPSSRFSL